MISSSLVLSKALSRAAASNALGLTAARAFSSACAPAQRLRGVLEEYRQLNYSDEVPSRFKKDMIKAMQGDNNAVQVDKLNTILTNIGRHDAFLSDEELNLLLKEAGSSNRFVTVDQILQLM